MRVFVTGGNGFIGAATVRQIIEQGHAVRCLLRETSDSRRIDDLPVERTFGDIRDGAAVAAGISGCDGVVHLAGLSAWDEIKSPSMHDVVVGGTACVLKAAASAGRPRTVVVSSSIAVNGSADPIVHDEESRQTLNLAHPDFVYAQAKVESEQLCWQAAESGLPVVAVNPCEVYGPGDTKMVTAGNLADFANSTPVLICRGGTSVVHVDDVATGIVRALEQGRPGQRYILGGDNLTIEQLASMTLGILGLKKPILTLPNGLIKGLAKIGSALHLPLPFNPLVIPYATLYWFMDNGRARRELGVAFRSAHDTLAPTLRWLQDAGYVKT
jgi:dihydroflavonol-4-reductase